MSIVMWIGLISFSVLTEMQPTVARRTAETARTGRMVLFIDFFLC